MTILLRATRALLLVTPITLVLRGGDFLGLFTFVPPLPLSLPLTVFPDVTTKAFLFRGLVETALAMWLVLICVRARFRPAWSPIMVCLVALMAAAALADACSLAPYRAFFGTAERMQGFIGLLHTAAFFVVASSVFDTRRLWQWFFHVTTASAVVVAVMCIAQFLVHGGWRVSWIPDWFAAPPFSSNMPDPVGAYRADARLGNPIQVAIFMYFHLFILGLLATWTNRRGLHVLYGIVAVLVLAAMVMTRTRAAYPALAAGVFAALALAALLPAAPPAIRRRAALALGGTLAIALLFVTLMVVVPSWFGTLGQRFEFLPYSLGVRWVVAEMGLNGFLDHPVLGWGQENFSFVFERHYHPRLTFESNWWDRPHNAFVGWLVAGGIAGGLAYAGLYVCGVWLALAQRVGLRLIERVGLAGMIVGYAVFNATLFDTLSSEIMLFGTLGYLHMRFVNGRQRPARRPAPQLVTAVTAIGATALWAFGIFHHNLHHYRATNELAVTLSTHGLDLAQSQRRGHISEADWLIPRLIGIESLVQQEAIEWALIDTVTYVSTGEGAQLPAAMRRRMVDDVVNAMLRQVEREGEKNLRSLFTLGWSMKHLGRLEEAIGWFEKALRLSPKRQLVLIEMGKCYMRLGDFDKGVAVFRAALEAWPDPGARELCIIAALDAGDEEFADQALAKAYPDDGEARTISAEVAQALWQRGRYRLLARIYRALVEHYERQLVAGVPNLAQRRREWLEQSRALATAQWGAEERPAAIATLRKAMKTFAADEAFTAYARVAIAMIEAGEPVPRKEPVVPMTERLR